MGAGAWITHAILGGERGGPVSLNGNSLMRRKISMLETYSSTVEITIREQENPGHLSMPLSER